MKQNYTMYIYKLDRRCKSGERLFSTTVWANRDPAGIQREVRELRPLYPESDYRFEWVPTTKIVRNLMSGDMVEIAHDTPRACDPSSELYWSM